MNRPVFLLSLIALLAACSSVPRTELRLESEAQPEALVAASGQWLDGEFVPAHALRERPHPHAVWVAGQYVFLDGRYIWVPGHWRDVAIAR